MKRSCSPRTASSRCSERRTDIAEQFSGLELVERYGSYEGPIFNTGQADGFRILADDFVTTEDGTGLVHIAPAFGEDDFRAAAASRVGGFDPTIPGTLLNPVRADGTFDRRVRSYDGREYDGRVRQGPSRWQTT